MATALICARRFTTGWSLPSLLADANILLAHAMLSAVDGAHFISTCIGLFAFYTPACRTNAIAHDTHPVCTAIRSSFSLIESRAVFQLAVLAVPEAVTVALVQRCVPVTIG